MATHSFSIQEFIMHEPIEKPKFTLSSPKLKNPTNEIDWLILHQVTMSEFINCGHKFGYYN